MTDHYPSLAYTSRNPLRRLSHKGRFQVAKRLVLDINPENLLDYGTGDGAFLKAFRDTGIKCVGFEPIKTKDDPGIVSSLEEVTEVFQCITCLEVLEHLTDEQHEVFFGDVARHLDQKGVLIVSVPVMIGPAGFLKVAQYFGSKREDRKLYTFRSAVRSALGLSFTERPLNNKGIYHHLGFDHRIIREKLNRRFHSILEIRSPFPHVWSGLNSQVFFVCREPT